MRKLVLSTAAVFVFAAAPAFGPSSPSGAGERCPGGGLGVQRDGPGDGGCRLRR